MKWYKDIIGHAGRFLWKKVDDLNSLSFEGALSFLFKEKFGVDPYRGQISMLDQVTKKRVVGSVQGGVLIWDTDPCTTEAYCQSVETLSNPATQVTETLTLVGNASDGDVVVLGSKTYTLQLALTDVDGNVLIGATASDTLDNLIAAINLAAGAGSTYAASMTANTEFTAVAGAGDTMDVTTVLYIDDQTTYTATTDIAGAGWGSNPITGADYQITLNGTALAIGSYPIAALGDASFAAQLRADIIAELNTQGITYQSVTVVVNAFTYTVMIVNQTSCTELEAITWVVETV